MVSLRGDIIPVLNLRTLFGLQTTKNLESVLSFFKTN